ncbi:hypothetical protein FGO68_gene8996 [Halteria grandinella]|uniref:Uncharacterized protein n=1 Tax=Halteria grandinella TaxID=5974 RepID=A0A8J8P2X0_HALGN|nr:hypothetical protein FGO68_gene8996 [Halteria grandinella]
MVMLMTKEISKKKQLLVSNSLPNSPKKKSLSKKKKAKKEHERPVKCILCQKCISVRRYISDHYSSAHKEIYQQKKDNKKGYLEDADYKYIGQEELTRFIKEKQEQKAREKQKLSPFGEALNPEQEHQPNKPLSQSKGRRETKITNALPVRQSERLQDKSLKETILSQKNILEYREPSLSQLQKDWVEPQVKTENPGLIGQVKQGHSNENGDTTNKIRIPTNKKVTEKKNGKSRTQPGSRSFSPSPSQKAKQNQPVITEIQKSQLIDRNSDMLNLESSESQGHNKVIKENTNQAFAFQQKNRNCNKSDMENELNVKIDLKPLLKFLKPEKQDQIITSIKTLQQSVTQLSSQVQILTQNLSKFKEKSPHKHQKINRQQEQQQLNHTEPLSTSQHGYILDIQNQRMGPPYGAMQFDPYMCYPPPPQGYYHYPYQQGNGGIPRMSNAQQIVIPQPQYYGQQGIQGMYSSHQGFIPTSLIQVGNEEGSKGIDKRL